VNNAVRHSGAETVNINSEFEQGTWRLKVCDNGKGFNLVTSQNIDGHYGLGNMQDRAKAAALLIYIESTPQKGTNICVGIPIIRTIVKDAPNGVLQMTNA
jgi:signal transduction histidine kinase